MVARDVNLILTLSVYYWIGQEGKGRINTNPKTIGGAAAMMEVQAKYLKKIHQRGVKIALGTDTGNIKGRGQNARELEMLVECGLTLTEALIAGTRVSAEAMGLQKHLGTFEPNKLGDVLILSANRSTTSPAFAKRTPSCASSRVRRPCRRRRSLRCSAPEETRSSAVGGTYGVGSGKPPTARS